MSQTKAQASGVDLSGLTAAQLTALSVEAKAKAIELAEKETQEKFATLKDSGEFKKYKAEWQALQKEGKKLSRKSNFEITLPIRFTMASEMYDVQNLYWSGSVTEDDLFEHKFTASLTKDANLTKTQKAALNQVIADYAEQACEDVFDIVPEELMQHYHDYAEKVEAFYKKIDGTGIKYEDLK